MQYGQVTASSTVNLLCPKCCWWLWCHGAEGPIRLLELRGKEGDLLLVASRQELQLFKALLLAICKASCSCSQVLSSPGGAGSGAGEALASAAV